MIEEPVRDSSVILCGVHERLGGERAAQLERGAAGLHRGNHLFVACGRHDDCRVRVILRGCAHHGGATDVNVLDHVGRGLARRNSLLEGVEVHNDKFEGREAESRELLAVVCETQVCEQPRVHCGVQGLHAAVERLGKTSNVCNVGHAVPGVANGLRGRSGRHDLDAGASEGFGELEQAALVAHRDERAAHLDLIAVLVEAGVLALNCHARAPIACCTGYAGVRGSAPVAMSRTVSTRSGRSICLIRSCSSSSLSSARIDTAR